MPDLIFLLEGGGLGLTYGTNLFKGPMAIIPTTAPGPFVSLIRTGGLGVDGTHNLTSEPAYELPTAQIVVRAQDYDDAETLALQIWNLFYGVQNQFINGTWWQQLNPRSQPFDLPLDEKGRPRIAFNIDVVKRMSPATS